MNTKETEGKVIMSGPGSPPKPDPNANLWRIMMVTGVALLLFTLARQ